MAATKGGKKAVTAVRRRRERKNIERGAAHIQSTFNNTIVTITDRQCGILGKRRRTRFPWFQKVHAVRSTDRCGDRG